MKKNYHTYISGLLLVTLLFFLCKCDDKEDQEKADIVSDIVSELNFTSGKGDQIVTFTTNKDWEVVVSSSQGDASWCSASPLRGSAGTSNITISAAENTVYDDRSATITIKTGNTIKTIPVIQRQKDAIIISKDSYEIPEEGGIVEIEANTNVELELYIPTEVTWIRKETTRTRALSEKKIMLIVDQNTEYDDRQATIKIKDLNNILEEKVVITQAARKSIHVEKEGTLSSMLTLQEIQNIKTLTITGTLNNDDFIVISQMTLQYLDISGISNVTLPSGLFRSNISIQEVILPNQLAVIPARLFEGSSITDIKIPITVKIIEESAFSDCYDITGNLILPEGLTEIENHAFLHCRGLSGDLVLPDGIEVIEGTTFLGCTGFTGNLVLPETVTEIGNYAFYGCSGFTGDLIIPETVTKIGQNAFYGCSGFTGDLIIPEAVTKIGESAFEFCSGFNGILKLPKGLRIIEQSTFFKCSGLKGNLILPEDLYELQSWAFGYCNGFTGELKLPKGVNIIRGAAFSQCSGFTGNLILHEALHTIGDNAFNNCDGLEKIYSMNPTPVVLESRGTFPDLRNKYLGVVQGAKVAYENARFWRDFLIIEEVDFDTLFTN